MVVQVIGDDLGNLSTPKKVATKFQIHPEELTAGTQVVMEVDGSDDFPDFNVCDF